MPNISIPRSHNATLIRFVGLEREVNRKTDRWDVIVVRSGLTLGLVEWHIGFRMYGYFPMVNGFAVGQLFLEHVSLRDIAAFIEGRTQEHRQNWRRQP